MARKMKDSGIEWIGEIPEGWEIVPVRSCFDEVRTKNTDGQEQNALQFKSGNIISKTNFNASMDDYVADTITNYTVVLPDTVMINGLNLNYDFKSLRVALVKEKGVITSAYLAIFPDRKKIFPQYATYLFKGYETKMAFHNMGAGIRKTLGYKEFKNQPLLLPSKEEQNKISAYLDSKCSHIDIMLSKIRSSIEEYKKLKQAVITQAVTKGVRGEREMKDSGVEWIGEIPKEWSISRIKYVSDFEPSCNTSRLTPESVITYSPMECIKNGFFEHRSALYGALSHTLTPFQNGDIVMAKVTPCFENGNISIMENLESGYGLGSSELFVFRPQNIFTQYLFYWLQNQLFVHRACSTMSGTGGLKRVSPAFMKNCAIHVPPTDEQREIADFLDTKCAEIDKLIAKKEQLVKELESYKKSLIYEVVTGKREV